MITGTYTLTPTKTGYAFTPASYQVSLPPDATEVDFTAIPLQLWFSPLTLNDFSPLRSWERLLAW